MKTIYQLVDDENNVIGYFDNMETLEQSLRKTYIRHDHDVFQMWSTRVYITTDRIGRTFHFFPYHLHEETTLLC